MASLRCPAPLQALGQTLGATTLTEIFTRFGLEQAPDLPIPTETGAIAISDPGLAAVGQENLTITPLQAALATAALAGDGRVPAPRLVEGLEGADGEWTIQPAGLSTAPPAVTPEAAAAVRGNWPVVDGISEFVASVLSGPDGSRNAWYLGMAPADKPRFVLALVLEGEGDLAVAESIGRELLNAAVEE
jgi:peptidoglycan glycosyltransferase